MNKSGKMKRKRSMKLAGKMAGQDQVIREFLTLVEEKLVIMSGKGGVDKTTVAINLAVRPLQNIIKGGPYGRGFPWLSYPKNLGPPGRGPIV